MFGWGIFFGFMTAMALYHLFVYLTAGSRHYLSFAIMVFAVTIHQFTVSAIAPDGLTTGLAHASASAALITICLLAGTLLNSRRVSFSIDKPYLAISAAAVVILPAALLWPDAPLTGTAYTAVYLAFAFGTIWASVSAVRRRERMALYLLFGCSFHLLGFIIMFLHGYVLPSIFFTKYAMQIGSALLVFMLSLGIAGNMFSIRRYGEKEKTRRLMLERLQEYTRNMAATFDMDAIRDIAVTGFKELAGTKRGWMIPVEAEEAVEQIWLLPKEISLKGKSLQKAAVFHHADFGEFGYPGIKGAYIAVPIISMKQLQAIALLLIEGTRRISPDTLIMLDDLAEQTAVALENARLFNETHQQATTDGLTGLLNRTTFFRRAGEALMKAKQEGVPFAVMMVDADEFKRINDTYGHDVGDMILQRLAKLLRNNFKGQDIIGRYGGEEFVIALPQTDLHEARILGERLRKTIESGHAPGMEDGTPPYTISIGISAVGSDVRETLSEVVQRADQALYSAKRGGRNRVESK